MTLNKSSIPESFESSSNGSSRSLPFSLPDARIIPRSTSNLELATKNWKELEKIWNERRNGKNDYMNVYEITSMTKIEIDLTWTMVNRMFPTTAMLRKSDKSALLRNFILKLWQLVSVFDCIENVEYYENTSEGEYERTIVSFYEGSFEDGKDMSRDEILRVFQPFWDYTVFRMAPTIVDLKMDKKELMAIVWLSFFDPANTNISNECQDMCRNIRKVIFRELRNFQIDDNFEESRFIETIETLEIIEKLEQKFMEEMLLCVMHNVRIHEDFVAILKENKI